MKKLWIYILGIIKSCLNTVLGNQLYVTLLDQGLGQMVSRVPSNLNDSVTQGFSNSFCRQIYCLKTALIILTYTNCLRPRDSFILLFSLSTLRIDSLRLYKALHSSTSSSSCSLLGISIFTVFHGFFLQ